MYIRDARNKYDQSPWNPESKEPNPYYEGYLNKEDKKFINAYDYTVDEADNFFYNLDTFVDDIESEDFDIDKVDMTLLEADEIPEADKANATRETRIMLWFKESLAQHFEMNRDELVTSMLDNMDEKEYQKNYNKFWREEKKNEQKANMQSQL